MKTIKNFNIILILIMFFVILLSNGVRANVIKISIPENTGVRSDWITLGEIATISGAKGEELARLKAVRLGKAVFPGYTRDIYREQIKLVLKNEGFSLEGIELDCPERVIVETKSRKINGEELVEEAKKYIVESLNYPSEKVLISFRQQVPEIYLPDRDYQLKFEDSSGGRKIGNVSLQVHIIIDDQVYRRVYLPFEVQVKQQVYIARRPISIGEVIRAEDFIFTEKALGNYSGELINDLNIPLIKYGRVKIPIPQDSILTSRYLIMPDLIKAGDEVQAEVITGSVKVLATVRARQNGKIGDYITVENTSTGYRFKAQVISSYLVRVVN